MQMVVMGVSGSGKSTVARRLAEQLACPLLEGDTLHSAANVARMSAGTALTDEDRHDWLRTIARHIGAAVRSGTGLVVTCSALKRRYRDVLRSQAPHLVFVHLTGDERLIEQRLASRHAHFMSPTLLASQFAILQPPGPGETAIACDVAGPLEENVASILRQLAALHL